MAKSYTVSRDVSKNTYLTRVRYTFHEITFTVGEIQKGLNIHIKDTKNIQDTWRMTHRFTHRLTLAYTGSHTITYLISQWTQKQDSKFTWANSDTKKKHELIALMQKLRTVLILINQTQLHHLNTTIFIPLP